VNRKPEAVQFRPPGFELRYGKIYICLDEDLTRCRDWHWGVPDEQILDWTFIVFDEYGAHLRGVCGCGHGH
jgi:hypothetical protein